MAFEQREALPRWITWAAGSALVFSSMMAGMAQEAKANAALSPDQQAVLEVLDDYTGFAPYNAGIILPAQITPEVFDRLTFIDTCTADEFATATIKGAAHIEWRDVFGRIDEIPTIRKVVLFCNTGALSAQSAFGLRALGFENVLILQTGFEGWAQHAASVDKS